MLQLSFMKIREISKEGQDTEKWYMLARIDVFPAAAPQMKTRFFRGELATAGFCHLPLLIYIIFFG